MTYDSIKAQAETQMLTQEPDGWSLIMFNHPKMVGKRMVVDRQNGQNQIRVQEVQSGRQACGQGRQNGQAGVYRVQKEARVKIGRTRKGE